MRVFAVIALVTACGGETPNAICFLGSDTSVDSLAGIVAAPSTQCYREGPPMVSAGGDTIPGPLISAGACPSSTCLVVPLTNTLPDGSTYPPMGYGLSTAECENDDDCIAESPCASGFMCEVPPSLTVGPFCCKKYCVCSDYVALPPGGLPTPVACDPTLAENACCNLAGRIANPTYPLCKP